MCDPLTLGIIAGGATIAAAGGQIAQGQSTAAAGRSRARLFAAQAAQRRAKAEADAGDFRKRQSRLLAKQRAGTAASGVSFEGTPILVGGDTAQEAELQAQKILVAGLTDAIGLDTSAAFERSGASDAEAAGFINAGSTLLTGFSRVGFGSSGKKIPTSTTRGGAGRLAGPV